MGLIETDLRTIDLVFDGPPGPECGRFVETENEHGHSIGVGDWIQRPDGYWVLRITGVFPNLREHALEPWLRWTMEEARAAGIADALAGQPMRAGSIAWPGHYVDGYRAAE